MLLSEISMPKVSTSSGFNTAMVAFAERYHFHIDKGNNAYVLIRSDRDCVWRAWIHDPGYEKWIQLLQQHQGNPHFVKILSKIRQLPIEKMSGTLKGMSIKVVKLEKLKRVTNPELEAFVRNVAGFLYDLKPEELQQVTPDDVTANVAKYVANSSKLASQHRSFIQAAIELVRDHGGNDLNSDNIMLRGNTLVIADPFGS